MLYTKVPRTDRHCQWVYSSSSSSSHFLAGDWMRHHMCTALKFSLHIIRSIGTSFSLIGAFLSSLVYVQAAPTALASIGWKYYLIFIIITFLSTFLFAFVFPETKGRSLEELNAEFGDEVAVDYSESSKVDFTQLRETMLHNFNVYLTSDSAVPEESPAQEPTGETDSKQVVA